MAGPTGVRSALAIAALAAREHAARFLALAALLGAGITAAGITGTLPGSPEQARVALGWATAAAELAAVLGAALLPAIGLADDLRGGLAALFFTRRLRRGELALGRALGGVLLAGAGGLAALAGALLSIALLLGGDALASLAPRDAVAASFERLTLAPGEERGWTLAPPEGLRGAGAVLRVAPRYQLVEGIPANRGGTLRLRVTPVADGRALAPIEADLPTLGATEIPLPLEALAGKEARLLLENSTEGSLLVLGAGGLSLRGPPRSLALAGLALGLGLACEAAFVAAIATLGATFMGEWTAALLALSLLVLARTPEDLRSLLARAAEASRQAQSQPATGSTDAAAVDPLAGAPPPLVLTLAEDVLAAAARLLPDLSRTDLAAPLHDGRTVDGEDLRRAVAAPLPWAAGALLLAALALSRREVGLGRDEVS